MSIPTRRHYIDNSPQPTFGPNNSTDVSLTLSAATGLPTSFPFTACLDIGTAAQENVLCTNISGTTATVTRNADGLGAFSHAAAATFTHVALAQDFDEANAHTSATTGVHGVTGAVVGTTDTQTLSNKTFSGVTFTANSGNIGVLVSGDGTGDYFQGKLSGTTVFNVTEAGNLNAKATGVTTLTASSNATVGGTLGVTGVTTLAAVSATTITGSGNASITGTLASGAATLASASVTGNASVGGTLGVTGASTLSALTVTGNAGVGGTFGVTGVATFGAVTANTVTARLIAPVYTNESARDTAIASPSTGDRCSLTSPTTDGSGFVDEVYSGSHWVPSQGYRQFLLFTPAGNTDTSGSGTGTWATLGNVNVPPWATRCVTNTTANEFFDQGSNAIATIVLKIGSATGQVSKRIAGFGTGARFDVPWDDMFTSGLSSGSQSVTISSTYSSGTTFRADTTSYFTVTFDFLP